MQKTMTRRALIQGGLMAGALVPALSLIRTSEAAAPLAPLDVNDPTAKALGFVNDTTKVDDKANPTHKVEQKCATCAQFLGKAGDARGGCNIFVGKSVPAGGWCKTWAKKVTP